MSVYLILNIATILFPLFLTFEKKLKFYSKIPFFFLSFVTIGTLFIIWDIIAAGRGDWAFNPEYVNGVEIFNLPLEEILFFITVPYACIFLYETAKYYLGDRKVPFNEWIYNIVGFAFFVFASMFYEQYYTFTVLIFTGAFFIIAANFYSKMLQSALFWGFIVATYIPFIVVNYLLTSLPVVTYSPEAIWGIRFITIPLEDFFYSFSMISLYLLIYLSSGEAWQLRKKLR